MHRRGFLATVASAVLAPWADPTMLVGLAKTRNVSEAVAKFEKAVGLRKEAGVKSAALVQTLFHQRNRSK